MFFDTIQSQANSQNTNLSNNISVGSTGSDFGNFSPLNETKPEFKSSNDLGLSAALGAGAQSGSVGMSRAEENMKEGSTFDGYTMPDSENFSTQNILMYIGVAITFALSVFAIVKKRK